MHIEDFEVRLERLSATLAHLLNGDFDAIGYPEVTDDPLGRIEETVQFLVMDIKTVTVANRDKEASLLLQQEQLTAKSGELAQQQLRIHQQARELAAKVDTIERQADAIRALSTPILEVWDKVLVLPLIGVVDAQRSEAIMTKRNLKTALEHCLSQLRA